MTETYLESRNAGLELWPSVLRVGNLVRVTFRVARMAGATSPPWYRVTVLDSRRRLVATLLNGDARPVAGVVCVDWDGRDYRGVRVPSGAYRLCIEGLGRTLHLERTVFVDHRALKV